MVLEVYIEDVGFTIKDLQELKRDRKFLEVFIAELKAEIELSESLKKLLQEGYLSCMRGSQTLTKRQVSKDLNYKIKKNKEVLALLSGI